MQIVANPRQYKIPDWFLNRWACLPARRLGVAGTQQLAAAAPAAAPAPSPCLPSGRAST
jgi:hypothetical protein